MMSKNRVLAVVIAWVATITGLHLWLNFDWASFLNDFRPEEERRLNVAYIAVT